MIKHAIITLSILSATQACGGQNGLNLQWEKLCVDDGCLTGCQNYRKGPGFEGSIFRTSHWQSFFQIPSSEVIPFLMTKLSSTNSTSIHVCPWFNATEGELALFSAQHIVKTNWFELKTTETNLQSFIDLKKTSLSPVTKIMLEDSASRDELSELFISLTR